MKPQIIIPQKSNLYQEKKMVMDYKRIFLKGKLKKTIKKAAKKGSK